MDNEDNPLINFEILINTQMFTKILLSIEKGVNYPRGILSELGIAPKTFYRIIKNLIDFKLIDNEKENPEWGSTTKRRLFITEKGKTLLGLLKQINDLLEK